MKKENCVVCFVARGRRVCKLNDNKLICPVCCARTRIPECEGCVFYTQAEQFSREKPKKKKFENFIVKIDPEYEPALINREIVSSLAEGQTLSSKIYISETSNCYPTLTS